MGRQNRKAELIDATMQVISEAGLSSFAMKKVTDRIGVGETLIYKYFETKEKLLYTCFEVVHKQIAALFHHMEIPDVQTPQDVYATVYALWISYFDFLVNNSYRTVFYFEYRDSPHIRQIAEHDEEAKQTYFQCFVEIFLLFDTQFHIYEKTGPDFLWTYILDTTGLFAKRVIRGELPDTPESRENIWRLLSGGMFGLLQ